MAEAQTWSYEWGAGQGLYLYTAFRETSFNTVFNTTS